MTKTSNPSRATAATAGPSKGHVDLSLYNKNVSVGRGVSGPAYQRFHLLGFLENCISFIQPVQLQQSLCFEGKNLEVGHHQWKGLVSF